MTLSDITTQLVYRLGNTSTEAIARLKAFINTRHQWVCSDVGLEATERTVVTATTTSSPLLTFTGITRLSKVYDGTVAPERNLTQLPIGMIDINPAPLDPPAAYAVWTQSSTSITIRLSGVPNAGHVLSMLGDLVRPTLGDTDEPAFPAQFHDLLIYGAEADEYSHRQMKDLAMTKEQQFGYRLSQLRLFMADSDFKQMRQGLQQPSGVNPPPPFRH